MRTMTVALAVLACQAPPLPAQTLPGADGAFDGPPLLYRVSSEDTEILIRVFTAGPLSRFGHNHVIAAQGIEGTVALGADGAASRFVLRVPVRALEVDPPDRRRDAGEAFAAELTAADILATRGNMLGPQLLDAARYPVITVRGTTQGAAQFTAATVRFEIKQTAAQRRVPIDAQVTDESIRVTGVVELSHDELGLRPFRTLAGALRVAQRMQLSFEIVALREP